MCFSCQHDFVIFSLNFSVERLLHNNNLLGSAHYHILLWLNWLIPFWCNLNTGCQPDQPHSQSKASQGPKMSQNHPEIFRVRMAKFRPLMDFTKVSKVRQKKEIYLHHLRQAKLILGICPAAPLSQLSLEEVHRRFVFKCNLESQVSLDQPGDYITWMCFLDDSSRWYCRYTVCVGCTTQHQQFHIFITESFTRLISS